jgi:hypothetical protein
MEFNCTFTNNIEHLYSNETLLKDANINFIIYSKIKIKLNSII